MYKITDEEYKLPQIEALTASHVLESGTTQPMLIHGVDIKSGERGQFVVKFMNNPRMSVRATCFELWGAWLGNQIGINVAEPVIIHISSDFAQSLIGKKGYQNAIKSIGLNFGTAYRSGMIELINGKFFLETTLMQQAESIFAFDMLISNADRGAGKPNVLTNSKDFMIYDHELAFSFVSLLSFHKNKTPWIITEVEREMYEKHYFYSYLRDNRIDFSNFVNSLSEINDDFWAKVEQFTPTDWFLKNKEEFQEIKNHLQSIILNKNIFSEELTRILLT
jgi:hypothetical protein